MDADQSDSHLSSIDATLAEVIETLPARPPWYERWQGLEPHSLETERLAVYQEIRDSQSSPHGCRLSPDRLAGGRTRQQARGDRTPRLATFGGGWSRPWSPSEDDEAEEEEEEGRQIRAVLQRSTSAFSTSITVPGPRSSPLSSTNMVRHEMCDAVSYRS